MYENEIKYLIFALQLLIIVYSPKFYRTVVSNFSWVLQSSQEKFKDNAYQDIRNNKLLT